LAPYLLWSVLFIFFSTYKVKSMPLEGVILWTGGTLALPVAFTDGGMFVRCFLYGKSYFHLYFMSVLLQMSLIFPFIYLLLQRMKRSFGFWLFTSLSIHALVVSLNYQYRFLPYPASTVLWYAPPIILGAWLGMCYTRWDPIWREYKNAILLLFGVGTLSYLIVEIFVASNSTESLPSLLSRAYPFSLLLYATSTAIILLKLSHLINHHPAFGPLLARFGDRSLALFLMHPIILHFLSGPRITKVIDALPASGLWLLLLVITMTWISVEALYRLRLNVWLFGREDQYGPLAPKPKHAVTP
ncbi:MAG: acyltransferase, partial [Candidatus Caldarchaeum sp.]